MSFEEFMGLTLIGGGLLQFGQMVLGEPLTERVWFERLNRCLTPSASICLGAGLLAPAHSATRPVLEVMALVLSAFFLLSRLIDALGERWARR